MSDIEDLYQIILSGIGRSFDDLAEEIIAAGFHRDRTITTAEELDALPEGSVVLNADGDALQNNGEIWWLMGSSTPNTSGEVEQFDGPLTLIHEGAAMSDPLAEAIAAVIETEHRWMSAPLMLGVESRTCTCGATFATTAEHHIHVYEQAAAAARAHIGDEINAKYEAAKPILNRWDPRDDGYEGDR